jgi:hypothetical protein
MRKPRNMWEFCGELFLLLGVIFVLFGVLSRAGVLKTDPASLGDPGVVFPIIGGGFLIAGLFSLPAGILKENRRIRLFETGVPVTGKIEAVKQNLFTKWGTYHPYVIYFTYEVDGVPYKGKSGLFWALPPTLEHEKKTVFIDADHPKRCALKL